MFLQRDPFMQPRAHQSNPCHQYRRVMQDLDDLLSPAMYLLQHLQLPQTTLKKPEATPDKNSFSVKTDVQQFLPEELTVKLVDKFVVIEGKHQEKEDEHGFVSRQFLRRYAIPEDVKPEAITCNLSSDGVLILSAPRMIEGTTETEKTLPINFTGQPAPVDRTPEVAVEQKNPTEENTAPETKDN